MDQLKINGGNMLDGSISIQKSKNATLPIMAACVMCDGEVYLENIPKISDCDNMLRILIELGCVVNNYDGGVRILNSRICNTTIPSYLTGVLRSSFFLLGPLVARFKSATIAYPGGCDIGLRPIDLHLKGLKMLGCRVEESNGYIMCAADELKGSDIYLDFPSVGATENIIMAASLARGETKIRNCAREPEIVDLANFLNFCGAKIYGAGTDTIRIEGVKRLNGVNYTPISDRIILGTYYLLALMCGGEVELKDCDSKSICALLSKTTKFACKMIVNSDKIYIKCNRRNPTIDYIETMPYPGFPTDLQAPVMALNCVSRGVGIIVENMFESRFRHVPELVKMGAHIKVFSNTAFVEGVKTLHGAKVSATDLRGGAALILAAAKAEGETIMDNARFVHRGYQDIVGTLTNIGVDIATV